MDFRLELVQVPVSDVDRAKAFYVDQVGFNADHDHQVSDELRFVQLTPPGSACSITIGTGLTKSEPGSYQGLHLDKPIRENRLRLLNEIREATRAVADFSKIQG